MDKDQEKLISDAVEAVDVVQKEIDSLKDSVNGKLDVIQKDIVDKAAEAGTKAMESMQEVELKMKAQEERTKELELRAAKNAEDKGGVIDFETRNQFGLYLRKGTLMEEDNYRKIVTGEINTKCIGLSNTERELIINKEVDGMKDMVSGSQPDGGLFVLPELDTSLRTRLFETSPVRSVATVQGTMSSTVEMILDDDESACGWVGEVDARPTTDTAQFAKLIVPIHESYAFPRATQQQLDDAGLDIESLINNKSFDKIARTENTSFVLGNGSMKPKGFMTYSAWDSAGVYQRDALEQLVGVDTTSGFNTDDLIRTQNALHEPYQPAAIWGMTRTTFSVVMRFKDDNGRYLLNREMLLEGGQRQILGRPILIMSDMAENETDALAIVYGDFGRGYTIIDRIGFRVLRDPYTAKPYVGFYTTKRVGAAVTNYEALKILKSTTVA